MNLQDVTLTFGGQTVKVDEVTMDYSMMEDRRHVYCKGYLIDKENQKMTELITVPKNLDKFLNDNFKAFYKLGWVNEDLELTSKGSEELVSFMLVKHEEEFGKVAIEKVLNIEKESKSKK